MKGKLSMFLLAKQKAVFAESDCVVRIKFVPIKEMGDFKRVFFYFVHRHLQTGNHIGQTETASREVNYGYQL
jgi:hypothetical protein